MSLFFTNRSFEGHKITTLCLFPLPTSHLKVIIQYILPLFFTDWSIVDHKITTNRSFEGHSGLEINFLRGPPTGLKGRQFMVFNMGKNRQLNGPILMYFLQKSSARILNRQPMADGLTLISNPVINPNILPFFSTDGSFDGDKITTVCPFSLLISHLKVIKSLHCVSFLCQQVICRALFNTFCLFSLLIGHLKVINSNLFSFLSQQVI